MSPSPQDSPARPGGGRFDPIATPWFFPLLVLALLLSFRILAPGIAERQELAWFDLALSARAKLGFAEPLDPSIRFVELSVNDEIARRYATDGEYATVAGILRTLAALDVRVIAVDIIYAHGREEDQNLLAEAIREIHDTTRTTVVLSASKEMQATPPHLLRSLPRADYQSFVQGIVNVTADRHWREYRLVHEFDGETIPSLALAAYGASRASALAPKVVGDGAMAWKVRTLDGKTVDVHADGSRLFLNLQHSYYDDTHDKALENFSGRVFTIEQIEAVARDLAGNSPIRDTIVFLGYDADIDGKATTYGPMQPGMLLHGTALNDLMHGNAIRQAPLHLDVLVHLFVALCAAIAFTKIRSKRMLVVVAVTGACVILLFGWLTIWSSAILLLPAAVSAAELWGISVVLETGRRWGFEQRERTQRDAML
ncbi:MAG TPA: CHASE2 domain-containing protein, partial [Bacteroidia bacterium]|nr:CHASE2 domain-containing protein [Bacteroidia bacterium]